MTVRLQTGSSQGPQESSLPLLKKQPGSPVSPVDTRGKRRVGLTVDSQNATGATRLYEHAGMHIALQLDTYEKKLNI